MQLEANAKDLPFYFYDFEITEEALEDIEILTGPKMHPFIWYFYL